MDKYTREELLEALRVISSNIVQVYKRRNDYSVSPRIINY